MATEGFIQVPADSTGKKLRTMTVDIGGDTRHNLVHVPVASGGDPFPGSTSDPTSGSGVMVRPLPTGVQAVAHARGSFQPIVVWANGINTTTAEGLISFTINRNGTTTASQTSLNVTSGSLLLLTYIRFSNWNTATNSKNWARYRMRINLAGAAVVTSPIYLTVRTGNLANATGAGQGNVPIEQAISSGFRVPGGAGIGFTQISSAALTGTLDFTAYGYEWIP